MSHISTGVEYGLHCLLYLSRSNMAVEEASVRDLAELQGIPNEFLAKLFTKLAKAGLVVATEGIKGGFRLARPPSRELTRKGADVQKLALVQLWHEAGDLFSVREKAALAWAETVTRVADTHVPDDAFAAAAAVFEEKELADLTIAIGLMNAFNRLAISFRRAPAKAV
ncbi:Rrf2 family transcriptional regulator [Cupriavidus necator]|uniref:Rrf2 family transcriptional regulator n=1 Tax=Cupriavidus necator TaxID=106590 RepID=UPI00339DA73F